jgi:anti-sigma factor RsiW
MNDRCHEQIQRYVNGQSSAEEAAALQESLHQDAELRALYLDYINLDTALAAAADKATIRGNEAGRPATFRPPVAWRSPQAWRWIAAAAAAAALVAILALSKQREPSRVRPDISATIASTKNAIARMSFEPASTVSIWSSPTASLLDPSGTPPTRTGESGN